MNRATTAPPTTAPRTTATPTLRRFLAPPPAPPPAPTSDPPGDEPANELAGDPALPPFVSSDRRRDTDRRASGPRCEMCGEPIAAEHSHVADLEGRSIRCSCTACRLLFTSSGAGGGRYRAVPTRYLHAPSFPAGERLWAAAGIPVGLAFLVTSGQTGVTTAFYPSPAGATECELPVGDTAPDDDPMRSVAAFADLAPDVEALLVHQLPAAEGRQPEAAGFEGFLVPIDACYRLVGELRLHWHGFDGGGEVRERLSAFLDDARHRARRVDGDGGT